MDKLKRWGAYAAAFMAISAALVAFWGAVDWLGVRPVLSHEIAALETVVAGNTKGFHFLRWQLLDAKAKAGVLSSDELLIYCELSRLLGLPGRGC